MDCANGFYEIFNEDRNWDIYEVLCKNHFRIISGGLDDYTEQFEKKYLNILEFKSLESWKCFEVWNMIVLKIVLRKLKIYKNSTK